MINPPPSQIRDWGSAWIRWIANLHADYLSVKGGTIVGDLTVTGDITVTGNVNFTGLPTSDPLVSGRLWNNAGVLTVSAG